MKDVTRQGERQDGRRFVITGGNAGIGFCTARSLAQAGAEVVLAVRDVRRGDAAADSIGGKVSVEELDVSSLASVHDFADRIGPIDVLVNNAGVLGLPESRSVDGFELQLATNHLGHFALTNLMLPQISDRVVVVGSQAHRSARLDLDNLMLERGEYSGYRAYANSKLAVMLFLLEADRRLREVGSPLRAVGAHPGYTATKIMRNTSSGAFNLLAAAGNALVGMRPEAGAQCVVVAATADLPGNTYVGPSWPGEMRGRPKPVGRSLDAQDPTLAREMWRLSEELTGVGWAY
ncbi:MAG: SDR family NAD(P)-dependent oxidoreductase [Nocardioides sp.]|uniref:SDR family NAD(P)-dependent oxidoreductase n=1 Tax=Nocardioides sp. TaxID=35761 RepID=UPI003F0FCE25